MHQALCIVGPCCCVNRRLTVCFTERQARVSCHDVGLHKSDQQYMQSAKAKARKPEEEFLYATTASKRAERQRLVRFIRSDAYLSASRKMLPLTQTVSASTASGFDITISPQTQLLDWQLLWLTLSVIVLCMRHIPSAFSLGCCRKQHCSWPQCSPKHLRDS